MSDIITKLINNIGFNAPIGDIDPSNLGIEMFSSGINFRAQDDKLISYSGKLQLFVPPVNLNAGRLDYLLVNNNTYYVLLGRTACYVFDGTTWSDISPSGLSMTAGQELFWTTTKLGNIPVYCNKNFFPVYWSPQSTTQVLQHLKFDANTWQSKNYSCKSMRAHRNFLFALGLREGLTEYPYAYRWSHPADINGLPPSWDETNLSYIASKEQLAGSGGDIIDGCSLRDSFCIYSKSAITILNYVGGEFIWQAQLLSGYFGALTANCIVEFKGINYVITDGDILRNDGNSLDSILTTKLRRKFASSLSTANFTNCSAFAVPNKDEVWFLIVEQGSTYPSIAYIFNVNTNTISTREISGIINCIYAPKPASDDSWDTATDNAISWSGSNNAWDASNYSLFDSHVLGLGESVVDDAWDSSADNILDWDSASDTWVGTGPTSDSAIYTLDETNQSYNTILERTDWVPDDEISSASTILNIYPKIVCNDVVNIQIGSQQHVGDLVTWKPAILFNPNTDRKVSIRTTGKCHAWRISSVGNNPFKISGLGIEYTYAGKR